MAANSFGNRFVIHSFGESHGLGLGVVIDGCPAGIEFDLDFLRSELVRRRPGVWAQDVDVAVSQRQESDSPEVISGVYGGKTLGTPICILVRNLDQRSGDYDAIEKQARAGHADDMWKEKFKHVDHRGGGRSSGRETVARVMAGAVAKMLLKEVNPKIEISGLLSSVGPLQESQFTKYEEFQVAYRNLLKQAQAQGESHGGIVTICLRNLPIGLGQPVFHKLKSDLAGAMLSVGATIGFEFGDGFAAAKKPGTEFHRATNSVYGGIRGGISTGEEITMNIAFKPTSSILNIAKMGRHDPCVAIRAIPVLESMAALVIADHWLWSKTDLL